MEGVIVLVHKKGDKTDVNNYRCITLVSCFSKVFTIILNKRITSFCENNNAISDAQFRFRNGKPTVDALFILLNIVQHFLNENKILYCVFGDLKKCFDTIYKNALWHFCAETILRLFTDDCLLYRRIKNSKDHEIL
jgi:hypothetical protein